MAGTLLVSGVPGCSASPETRSYYVSLGDSYAVGYQPSPTPGATSGYTGVVATSTRMTLANFGCGGATSTSILSGEGCRAPFGPSAATGAVAYPTRSQAAAAEAFVRAHRGHVGLVTVSIGGNDITTCAAQVDQIGCLATALSRIERNVATLVRGLRAAAGPGVPIIGLTYPDVLLGLWVYPPGSPDHAEASLSVTAFESYVNPALASAYANASATFVDVTAATGAYTPLTETTTVAPYGTIPVAVASVCDLTWFCAKGNIHATTAGYGVIGRQIVAAFHKAAP